MSESVEESHECFGNVYRCAGGTVHCEFCFCRVGSAERHAYFAGSQSINECLVGSGAVWIEQVVLAMPGVGNGADDAFIAVRKSLHYFAHIGVRAE